MNKLIIIIGMLFLTGCNQGCPFDEATYRRCREILNTEPEKYGDCLGTSNFTGVVTYERIGACLEITAKVTAEEIQKIVSSSLVPEQTENEKELESLTLEVERLEALMNGVE